MPSYTIEQFLQLEIKVWDALVSGDAESDAMLLADEFLGVYNSGFADKAEHTDQLLAGPIIERYKLSEARIKILADGVVLLAYRAHYIRSKNSRENKQEVMYVSSIWRIHSGIWRNIFSQDTQAKQ